jgi:uncharacterized protein
LDGQLSIQVSDQEIILLPSGAVFWKEAKTLMLADLHLGKSTTFRRGGIPVPEGSTAKTLERWRSCIQRWQPEEVFVLGDLVHASCSWSEELVSGLQSVLDELGGRQLTLIEGNHDRGSLSQLRRLSIQVTKPPFFKAPFLLVHDPSSDVAVAETEQEKRIAIGGHIHPATQLVGFGDEKVRLRCFWLTKNSFVLPAFGDFTGHYIIESNLESRLYMIAGDQIIPSTFRKAN